MTTTNIRMRTLAERALRLLGVYQVTVPSLVALSPVLVPSALAYIKAYDDHQNFQAHHREHMGEGRAKVKALYTLMRHWTSVLTAIIPGFSEDSLHGTLSIPDQVLADAQRLIPLVEAHQDKLPDNSTLLAELNTMLTAATEEWNEAQRMLAEHAALIANVGTTKAALYLPFMSLRTTLHRLLGPTHRDCIQLRLHTKRKGADEAESDTDVEEAPQTETNPNAKRDAA